ncbi:MAG: hypothetical protein PHW34_08465 [Hespellia sp.]|nr:hypothetical protein [Hespellia sp.]
MFRIVNNSNRIYSRDGYGYKYLTINKTLKILLIHIFIFLFLIIFVKEPYKKIAMGVYAAIVITECIFLLGCYADGYMYNGTKMQYYQLYKKRFIKYKEINSMIVSHAVGRTGSIGYLGKYKRCNNGKVRFKPYAWITLCNKPPDKIKKNYNYTLDGTSVDYSLKTSGLIYSFIWNESVVDSMLKEYEGNFYITNSIALRYKKEIEAIIIKYKIRSERIHIITDIIATHFLWDNDF